MPFTPEIREMIVEADEAIDEAALGRLAVKQGMLTLQDSARAMVIAGETTIEEMSRVVFSGL